jgi:uncharacterized OsmC-like protein
MPFVARLKLFWLKLLSKPGMSNPRLWSSPLSWAALAQERIETMTTQETAQAPNITNGVNVDALFETIDAVKRNPAIADFQFRASNKWMGGDHNRTMISGFRGACEEQVHANGPFEIDNSEPPVLLGQGAAANPVEYVLHALAGCLTTSMVYHAAARGIDVESVSSEVEGDLDIKGFLGLDENVRKGFHVVRVRMQVKSEADAETLKSLAQFSPVFDIVSKSLPVEVSIEKI